MSKDKILISEQSEQIKNFLKEKLSPLGFEIIFSKDVFDCLIKMKNNIPDLVIMDFFLTQNSKVNFFEEKKSYKTIADVPVIMLSAKVDKEMILFLAKYKINKVLAKPIKIDDLLNTIAEVLNIDFNLDKTPCIIDIHLNDNLLFIEVASGLNKDKIETIKYKVKEIKDLYKIEFPKVLLILVDLNLTKAESSKLYLLLENIVQYVTPHLSAIKILTISNEIKSLVTANSKYCLIEATSDINIAIDKLSDVKIDEILAKETKKTKDDELLWANESISDDNEKEIENEKEIDIFSSNLIFSKGMKIAVVDDDDLILDLVTGIFTDTGVTTFSYQNGNDFVQDLENNNNLPDLIFLDLMMPKMNGFEVIEFLKKNSYNMPIIIFSALSQKETVKKVLSYGIKSYIVKPISPDIIIKKATEELKSCF